MSWIKPEYVRLHQIIWQDIEIINASHLKTTGASGWKDSNTEAVYANDLLVGTTDGSHGELMYLRKKNNNNMMNWFHESQFKTVSANTFFFPGKISETATAFAEKQGTFSFQIKELFCPALPPLADSPTRLWHDEKHPVQPPTKDWHYIWHLLALKSHSINYFKATSWITSITDLKTNTEITIFVCLFASVTVYNIYLCCDCTANESTNIYDKPFFYPQM